MKRLSSRHGFTLIETVVVIAVIGILSAIAIPNMIGWRAERKLDGAARNFMSDMQLARLTAIREAMPVSVIINGTGNSYRMLIDADGDYILDPDDREFRSTTMPAGVTLNPSFALTTDRTQFNSRGTASNNGTVEFKISSGSEIKVVLSQIGRLRLE